MRIKGEMRVVGWDDAGFGPRSAGSVPLIGAVFRGGKLLDGVLVAEAEIDGDDATGAIASRVSKSRHRGQLRLIMLDGITMAGFNYVNIRSLSTKTGLPVIAVVRKKTDMPKFLEAVGRMPHRKGIMRAVKDAGEFREAKIEGKSIYFQCHGIDENDARKAVQLTCTRGLVPEPLRVAHLIATALSRGESIGRA